MKVLACVIVMALFIMAMLLLTVAGVRAEARDARMHSLENHLGRS